MNFLFDEKRKAYKEIMVIGIPSILESLVVAFTSIVDSKMVSVLGVKTISAVAITVQPRLLIISLFLALDIVISSLVAKYFGEKNQDSANELLKKVLITVSVLSILFSILPIIFARPILIAFANQPDTINDSVIYFQILMAGMIFNTVYLAINAAFVGFGKTNITFVGGVINFIVNVTFNYLLIEGRYGFPALGVKGAAIATVLSYIATMTYSLIMLLNKNNFINLPYMLSHNFNNNDGMYKELAVRTKNTYIDKLAQRLSIFMIAALVARIGSLQMAVYSVCMHLFNIGFSFGTGAQTAAVALLGKAYGAKDNEGIKLYKDCVVNFTLAISIILLAAIVFSRHWFIGLFSDEQEFVKLGEISCIIVGVITLFQSMKYPYLGSLQGLGKMKEVMYTTIVSFSFVNIIALIVLVVILKTGLYGVWISSFLSQIVQGTMAYHYVNKSINNLSRGA